MLIRALGLTIALALVVGLPPSLAGGAPREAKVHRIGWLSPFPRSDFLLEAFLDEFRTLGWLEGRNFTMTRRAPDEGGTSLPGVATELVGLGVDLVVTGGTPNVQALRHATGTIPIVFGVAGDPVSSGLVASLARPGGNVTGVTLIADYTMVSKHLELLAAAVPGATRVAVLANPENATHSAKMAHLEAARRPLGLMLRRFDARSPDDLEAAFAAMRDFRASALMVLADTLFFQARKRIANLEVTHHLPAMYFLKEHVDAGGFMAYAPSLPALFRRAAHQADRILRGAPPGELPVERPTTFELILNLRTARAIGVTIPPSLLLRADEVIE